MASSEHEPYAVCSNQIDQLIIGGKNKTINTYSLKDDHKITKDIFSNPNLALKF